MAGEFEVRGFQGELRGNERRIQRRLPIFSRVGDDQYVYVPRMIHWNPRQLEDDALRVSVGEISFYGESVDLRTPIEPGEYLAIMGPEWVKATMVMSGTLTDEQAQQIGGFTYQTMNERVFNAFVKVGDQAARQVFDGELASGSVGERARAALDVLWGIGSPDYRGVVIRDLAAAYLGRDPDRFRRLLRIATARLDDDVRTIKSEVLDYIAVVQRDRPLLERSAEREVTATADAPVR